jgi:hypothetical protein
MVLKPCRKRHAAASRERFSESWKMRRRGGLQPTATQRARPRGATQEPETPSQTAWARTIPIRTLRCARGAAELRLNGIDRWTDTGWPQSVQLASRDTPAIRSPVATRVRKRLPGRRGTASCAETTWWPSPHSSFGGSPGSSSSCSRRCFASLTRRKSGSDTLPAAPSGANRAPNTYAPVARVRAHRAMR